MLELKEMLDRKERIDLRKEALLKELSYLEDEEKALSELIRIYNTRAYDPIEEESSTTSKITEGDRSTERISTHRLKSAVAEVVRTCGPSTSEEIAILVDRTASRVRIILNDMVKTNEVILVEGTWPRKYTIA